MRYRVHLALATTLSCVFGCSLNSAESPRSVGQDLQGSTESILGEVVSLKTVEPDLPIKYNTYGYAGICGNVPAYFDVEYPSAARFLETFGFDRGYIPSFEDGTNLLKFKPASRLVPELIHGQEDPFTNSSVSAIAGSRFCTGTIISHENLDIELDGEALFLTAAHCIQNVYLPTRVSGKYMTPQEAALSMVVELHYEIDPDTGDIRGETETVEVTALVENGYESYPYVDYALLRIKKPDSIDTNAAIKVAATNPSVGSYGVIFQQPGGGVKKVHAGVIQNQSNGRLHYSIDTKKGSSGAGVLDEWGELVGLHVQGGCEEGSLNKAVPISAIRKKSSAIPDDVGSAR